MWVTLRVQNTIAQDKPLGEPGIGLKNVRERLAVQFEGRAALHAAAIETEWSSVITIPAIFDSPVRDKRSPAALAEA